MKDELIKMIEEHESPKEAIMIALNILIDVVNSSNSKPLPAS